MKIKQTKRINGLRINMPVKFRVERVNENEVNVIPMPRSIENRRNEAFKALKQLMLLRDEANGFFLEDWVCWNDHYQTKYTIRFEGGKMILSRGGKEQRILCFKDHRVMEKFAEEHKELIATAFMLL